MGVRATLEQYARDYDKIDKPARTLTPATEYLRSYNYKVFERDPVKYDLYEQAIRQALVDWAEQQKPRSGDEGRLVVVVAGAGYGGLVTRALKAAKENHTPIELWAIERNPNAHVVLQQKNARDWGGVVQVVCEDIRSWKGPSRRQLQGEMIGEESLGRYPVDIVISELIGTFGDNELSPECLDGFIPLLGPWGISIPCSYTSFVTPIAAPKFYIHPTLQTLAAKGTVSQYELPTCGYFESLDYLSFKQGSTSAAGPGALGACHGLAGYFECILYPGIELSTNPNTYEVKSPDMLSWFTMFFPLEIPLNAESGSEMVVRMWRQTDNTKVWYEWMVEVRDPTVAEQRPPISSAARTRIHSSCKAAYRL
ncbi:hypothetical protein DL771_000183 [Monosporascus sp. 5C6A]|nr:hypothetical protein DL771_000183 [Monosporascus sp. 5C6A]